MGDVPARRRPRFLPFIVTGAVIGFVIGAWFASRGGDAEAMRTTGSYTATSAIGYLGFLGAGIAAVIAAVVAVLVDRRSNRG